MYKQKVLPPNHLEENSSNLQPCDLTIQVYFQIYDQSRERRDLYKILYDTYGQQRTVCQLIRPFIYIFSYTNLMNHVTCIKFYIMHTDDRFSLKSKPSVSLNTNVCVFGQVSRYCSRSNQKHKNTKTRIPMHFLVLRHQSHS